MVPRRPKPPAHIDVMAAMDERPKTRALKLPVIGSERPVSPSDEAIDPFAEVEV
jgi:hypothetical protein